MVFKKGHPPYLSHHSEETKLKIRMHHPDFSGEKNPFFGHKWSEKQRKLIVLSHIGKKHSEETKKKISIAKLNYYKAHPEALPKGAKNPMYGKHLTSKTKEKISKAVIEYYIKHPEVRKQLSLKYSGSNNPFYGKHHSLEARKKMAEKRKHRIIPFIDTKLEERLQLALLSLNIPFEKHKPIYGQPDIFISPNICIFVDGCYWHGCYKCKKGTQNKNYLVRRKIDRLVTKKLQSQGYVVLRFWEHEINENLQMCIEKILSILNSNAGDRFESS